MGGGLIGRALAPDHVGGDRPGRTSETNQRGFWRQFAGKDAQGLVDRREGFVDRFNGSQIGDLAGGVGGFHPGPFAGFKPELGAKRLRKKKNVREKDRCVKAITANRLQCDFGREIRGVAQRQKVARLGAGCTILRQIAARLAHHPDWRGWKHLAGKGAQDFFGHGGGSFDHAHGSDARQSLSRVVRPARQR